MVMWILNVTRRVGAEEWRPRQCCIAGHEWSKVWHRHKIRGTNVSDGSDQVGNIVIEVPQPGVWWGRTRVHWLLHGVENGDKGGHGQNVKTVMISGLVRRRTEIGLIALDQGRARLCKRGVTVCVTGRCDGALSLGDDEHCRGAHYATARCSTEGDGELCRTADRLARPLRCRLSHLVQPFPRTRPQNKVRQVPLHRDRKAPLFPAQGQLFISGKKPRQAKKVETGHPHPRTPITCSQRQGPCSGNNFP